MADFSSLASRLTGTLLLPESEGFAAEISGFNTATTHTPDAVVAAATAADVLETVRFARTAGVTVGVQSTGHGNPPIAGGILISMRALAAVTVNDEERTATFGGGTPFGPIVAAAAEHGLAPITGSSPTVGAVGLLLGGGLGPLARSHGFGSDYLRSLRVVTGAGELVTASADDNADLFWALRGGKSGLGIVVEATLDLVELPALYGGSLFFDIADASAVLNGWIGWARTADERITTSVLIARFPDLDLVPPPMRGRHLISLRFAFPGDAAAGERFAAPLRALAPVHLDALAELPAAAIARIHNDPTDPATGWGFGGGLLPLDDDFVEALLGLFGADSTLPLIGVEVRQWGGAMRTDVAEGSAVGGRDLAGGFHVIGVPEPSLLAEALPAAAAAIREGISAWISPTSTINYVEDPTDPVQFASAWSDETRLKLARIRAQYDPDHVFLYGPG